MDIIMDSLFDTDYGVIVIGLFLLIFIFIEFFSNKPKT